MINVNEELYRSIAFGNIDDVRQNLKDGANPNYNPRGTPPLFLSLYENKMDIFYLLLEHPEIDINIENIMGNTIIVECISQDLDVFAEDLIRNKSFMLSQNHKGDHPLHLAINYHKDNLVKIILQEYPDLIDIKDAMGNTPLLMASLIGNEPLVKIILSYNPSLDIKNKAGNDASYYLKRKSLENLIDNNDINNRKIDIAQKENKEENIKEKNDNEGLSTIKKRRNK